jgi:hypothetical protein
MALAAVRHLTTGLRRVLGVALLVLLIEGASEARAGDIVVLLNDANPTPEISLQRLRLLYGLYQRSWQGGLRVQLILPPPDSEALDFLVTKVFRKSDAWQLDQYYVQAVFQQMAPSRPPQLSARAAIEFVRSTPGGIALVDREEVVVDGSLRVLTIGED